MNPADAAQLRHTGGGQRPGLTSPTGSIVLKAAFSIRVLRALIFTTGATGRPIISLFPAPIWTCTADSWLQERSPQH